MCIVQYMYSVENCYRLQNSNNKTATLKGKEKKKVCVKFKLFALFDILFISLYFRLELADL